jgi:peroxiredoxin
MNETFRRIAIFTLPVLIISLSARAASQPKTLEIGQPAPDFKLPGVDGKTYSLKDFASAKILLIIFTCNHCPTAQAYEQRIIDLDRDYKSKGVKLVAISPNDPLALRLDELGYTEYADSFDEMKLRAKEHNFQFPYLYDGQTQSTSTAYGVVATPHVYIFDQERKLRYTGRIDDSEVKQINSHDTRNALDALVAGKPVEVPTTKVFGCSTKWAEKSEDGKKSIAKWNAEPVAIAPIDTDAVKALSKNDSKKLRLINVWATWCGPCVNELPELVTMNRMYRKRDFEMITISMDAPEKQDKALEMLKELHVSSKNYLYTGTNKDKLVEALDKDWPGPVPHTLLIAPGGKVIYRHTGEIDPMELKKAIVGYLGRTY